MNPAVRLMIVAVATLLLPQAASAGFLNVPKQSLDLPMAGHIGLRSNTLAPAGYYRLCSSSPSACKVRLARNVPTDKQEIRLTAATLGVIDSINRRVNVAMRPQAESGKTDVWKVGTSSGDCEDYALTKRQQLMGQGYPSSSLLIATVVTGRGESHAVLVVRTDRGDFVLDNLTAMVKPWNRTGYSFQTMQSPTNPLVWKRV